MNANVEGLMLKVSGNVDARIKDLHGYSYLERWKCLDRK
jgi:hypothetical protein